MMLAAEYLSEIELIVDGVDEEYLLEEIENYLNNNLGNSMEIIKV